MAQNVENTFNDLLQKMPSEGIKAPGLPGRPGRKPKGLSATRARARYSLAHLQRPAAPHPRLLYRLDDVPQTSAVLTTCSVSRRQRSARRRRWDLMPRCRAALLHLF